MRNDTPGGRQSLSCPETRRAATKDVEKLNALAATLKEAKDAYWTGQVEIQGKGAAAWVAFAEGRKDEAVAM